jgi:hypothetical protein
MMNYLKHNSQVILKAIVLIFTSTLLCLVSCNKEPNPVEEQFVRVYNLSNTQFDTIIIEAGYSYSGRYIYSDTLFNLEPNSRTSFVKLENSKEVLQFYLTTNDSTTNHHYGVWKYPSTLIDPMDDADWTFPRGYYTYVITESDSIEQDFIIALWTYSIYNPND